MQFVNKINILGNFLAVLTVKSIDFKLLKHDRSPNRVDLSGSKSG